VRECLRGGDILARLGGDEFTILLQDLPAVSETRLVAERIIAALAAPFQLSGQEVFVTTSIGIALHDATHAAPADLLRDADVALYRAKDAGRSGFVVFDHTMGVATRRRVTIEADLRVAIERGELTLDYQPKIELAGGAVASIEVFLRWQHPTLGWVQPAEFVAIAEETGLIVPLGRWVLEQACRSSPAWPCRSASTSPPGSCTTPASRRSSPACWPSAGSRRASSRWRSPSRSRCWTARRWKRHCGSCTSSARRSCWMISGPVTPA
jgi:predicted signal transduction protein with EAL and GGDEF domain